MHLTPWHTVGVNDLLRRVGHVSHGQRRVRLVVQVLGQHVKGIRMVLSHGLTHCSDLSQHVGCTVLIVELDKPKLRSNFTH